MASLLGLYGAPPLPLALLLSVEVGLASQLPPLAVVVALLEKAFLADVAVAVTMTATVTLAVCECIRCSRMRCARWRCLPDRLRRRLQLPVSHVLCFGWAPLV